MKFCVKCGKELIDDAEFCSACGNSTKSKSQIVATKSDDALINELSEKLNTNAIIWIVIGILQIIGGIFWSWFLAVVGVLNIISSIGDINYCKTLNQNRAGIVEKFEPLAGPMITLAYNLVFGGVIGAVGSIYYLVAIRSFVLQNREQFIAMDITAMKGDEIKIENGQENV